MPSRKSSNPKPASAANRKTKTTPAASPTAADAPPPRNGRAPRWGLLVYLAGDAGDASKCLFDDVQEILAAGGSAEVQALVQHDGPNGAVRYNVSAEGIVEQKLGRVDSGSAATLLNFLQWAMSICRAEHLALVLGSPLVVSPADAERDPDRVSVFSVAYDEGSGSYLDVCDMAGTVRQALGECGRSQVDVLAIDSCRVQFLELAYELEGIVRILIAPQTVISAAGWDYRRILARWKEVAANDRLSARKVATELCAVISECYEEGADERSVSALDLERLGDVANAFDTLCIGTLQSLGEGLIWTTRKLLLTSLHKAYDDVPVYDCGSFFELWAQSLQAMADESYQGWLGTTLFRSTGTKLDHFYDAVARHIDAALDDDRVVPAGEVGRHVRERLQTLLAALRAQPHSPERLTFLERTVGAGVAARIELLAPGASREQAAVHEKATSAREAVVYAAIAHACHLLPKERQFDLARTEEAAETARRLAAQAIAARQALLDEQDGLVISSRTTPIAGEGWPRWSGVSMYRPSKLDSMMHAGYTRFVFHQRVHWAALLGASNLIEDHPRALWRLVSSLLATGSAGTRRDVLRRLSGPDSVVWGLRDQFKVMAPAPTLTLSLEQRVDNGDDVGVRGARENYLLRLESITRGAVVVEQESRVQPDTMRLALNELNQLLKRDVMTRQTLDDLRWIGGLLGEDIFQTLGSRLEAERLAVSEESPNATPHLQLQIPRELMKYPWELLHHHGQWLGERYAMGRQVFMETGLSRRVPTRRQGQVRPLVVGDPVLDSGKWHQLPGARDEAEYVAGWFENHARQAGSIIDFDRRRDTRIHCRLTRAELRALLREGRYDIVHFAGHGTFRTSDPETSAWILSDGELWSLEIRNTLAEHPAPPWLVFANACEAGMDDGGPRRKYHDNVFGLATAFINQGVAAYIAPLWQIDDLLAKYIATNFYSALLCDRVTLGEALRRAKALAREQAYPSSEGDAAGQAWASLGWASLVLYGDPTEELFQALGGGGHRGTAQPSVAARQPSLPAIQPLRILTASTAGPAARPTGPVAGRPVLHAPDHVISDWVRGPNWAPASAVQRGGDVPAGSIVLELIEDAGLRRWRVIGNAASGTRGAAGDDALPGSQIAKLLADERVRELLPSNRGVTRAIGRWIIGGLHKGARGLVEAYDQELVAKEGLLVVNGTRPHELIRASEVTAPHLKPSSKRALVLIHGTFSRTLSPVDGFGPAFVEWARHHYGAVLGFDHWTLSKSPDENAETLVKELRAFDAGLLSGGRLDIVTHSRGGLVARAFCELLNQGDAVRNLIFLGTPNCGTDLANPRNWGSFADLFVNMTGVDGAEFFGRMAGLLAQLAAAGLLSDVPGLLAQSPEAAFTTDAFLHRLQNSKFDHARVKYGVICSEFEPAALVPNLKKIMQAAVESSLDVTMDALFNGANDLVVNTPYAWAIGRGPADTATLPPFLPKDRVLLFRPPGLSAGPTTPTFPQDIVIEERLGVHHCNLFGQRRVQETIKLWLADPAAGSTPR